MAQDVSEKYKLNEDLILSEKKFRELVENAAYGIYFADNEGKIIFANSKVCEMLGYTIEETLNLTVFDTYLPEEIDSGKLRSKMVSTGEHLKFSRKMLRKDGSTIDVEIGVSRMADGTALGIAQDITKRLRTEEALKESEERFKEIADLLPQTLFETDLRGNLKYVNHAGRIIFGFNNEDDAKKINIYNLLKVDDLIKAKENFNQIFSGGNRKGIEYSAHRKDGSEISIVVYSIPIIRKGAITGLRGLVIDNNERKEYEKQIIMAKEKAEEMNILKTNFLANMSHELRTPMIGILGFSDALTMELQDDDMRDMAETIHFSAERLMNTLNQLLDLSRIEANKADIKLEVLNIVDCLGNIIKTFDLAAKKRKLYLNYEIIDDGIFANLDKIMFEQVINNLINNAVKFTDKGGITVQVMKGVIDSINCSIIKVKDTGIGIEKENQNKIFEEFRQASEGISRKYEGTGLGLTITKKSLELMNGRISVESQPGVGSVFTISFPEYFSSLEKGIE
jgi:PAS domain S-box-containing protein